MNWRRVLGIAAAVAGLAAAGWAGWSWFGASPTATPQAQATVPATALDRESQGGGVETVDIGGDGVDPEAGTTPMRERVAVLGLLNKRNGQARDITLKPGEATRIGGAIIRLRACDQTAPWEPEHYTGAFVQLDVAQTNKTWKRVFSGWLFKERPNLNVVLDPVYDVWVKSCAMTFPGGGDSVAVDEGDAPKPAKRSSAPKSAPPADATPAGPTTPSTAPDSNAT